MTYTPRPHIIDPDAITVPMQATVANILWRAGVADTKQIALEPITYTQGALTYQRIRHDGDGRVTLSRDGRISTDEVRIGITSRGDRDWLEALCRVLDGPRPDVYRRGSARLTADMRRGTPDPMEDQP